MKKSTFRPTGKLYNGGMTKTRREWRGLQDNLYDYSRWLVNWGQLLKFLSKKQTLKAFIRYRWTMYLVSAMDFVDRCTEYLQGTQLRIAHTEYDFMLQELIRSMTIMFEADKNIGGNPEKYRRALPFDENMMEHLSFGFPDLDGVCPQLMGVFALAAINQKSQPYYIDRAEVFGITGDVCTMPKSELGLALDDDIMDLGLCMIHCNTTCDSSLMGNGIEDWRYAKPTFALAAPEHIEDELVLDYGADEIRSAIRFIEEHTGAKWNWEAYFQNMKHFNDQTRFFLEILDLQKTNMPVMPENVFALYREIYYTRMLNAPGEAYVETEEKIRKLMYKAYEQREPVCAEMRHRAIMWGVQGEFYTAFPNWLLKCWGIVPVVHFMNFTSLEIYAEEDTPENREKAMYDLASLAQQMIMRNRSEGGFTLGVHDLFRFAEEYHADMIVMYEQIACKAMTGYHGIYEEEANRRGIHLIWVTHALLDPRKASRQNMRDEVNRYMRTVLNEEPLDPTLETIADENAW